MPLKNMKIMKNEELKMFDDLKMVYSKPETTESEKKELIKLMQENLMKRSGKDSGTIKCLDGNEYSLDSQNPSELYAIDGALRAAEATTQCDIDSEEARNAALGTNKYSPNNPYKG